MPVFLAYSAFLIAPEMVKPLLEAEGNRFQEILPTLILERTPLFAQVMFFGALLSAILSTASGALLAPTALFTENVLKRLYPHMGDRQFLLTLRLVLVIFTLAVVTFALASDASIYQMVQNTYKVTLVSCIVPLVAGIFWSRATAQGALLSIALGLLSWIGMEIYAPDGVLPAAARRPRVARSPAWSAARTRRARRITPRPHRRNALKVKAAIAFAPGKPLEIELVDLEGPRAGEVLVELKATGVCHTDEFTRSGADPEGLFPAILGHEGAGVVAEVGPGVTTLEAGDHVIPLYIPECRQCKACLSRKTNLCIAIRGTQGKGVMPDGTSRFSLKGKPVHHYMGCSTFASHTVLPEIALAKIRSDAPFDKVCYIGCGVTTGIGAVINTAECRAGRERRRVRARRHRAQRPSGRAARRRRDDRRGRREPRARGAGMQVRHDAFRKP